MATHKPVFFPPQRLADSRLQGPSKQNRGAAQGWMQDLQEQTSSAAPLALVRGSPRSTQGCTAIWEGRPHFPMLFSSSKEARFWNLNEMPHLKYYYLKCSAGQTRHFSGSAPGRELQFPGGYWLGVGSAVCNRNLPRVA